MTGLLYIYAIYFFIYNHTYKIYLSYSIIDAPDATGGSLQSCATWNVGRLRLFGIDLREVSGYKAVTMLPGVLRPSFEVSWHGRGTF